MISNCPSCGLQLSKDHIIGRYLCCPACRNEFIIQGDIVAELSVKYFPTGQTWENIITYCFADIIEQADKRSAESLKIAERNEINLPFVDVIDDNRNDLMQCVAKNNPIGFNTIPDVKQFTHMQQFDKPPCDVSGDMIQYDMTQLDAMVGNNKYIGDVIKYIPIKYLTVDYGDKLQRFISFGNRTIAMTSSGWGDLKSASGLKTTTSIPKWYKWGEKLFALAVIVAAWYQFCYTYYHFHGFFDLIVFAEGLKYFLLFLGVCFGVLLFNPIISDFIADLYNAYSQKKLIKAQEETRQIIMRKFKL